VTARTWPPGARPDDDTHQCPARGCARPVPPGMLMCPADWRRVPKPLQRAVWAAWDDGRGQGTPAHRAACRAAIAAADRQRAREASR